ncbi:hypothetical protein [Streptomyces sp. PSAA01]|uniref:hypothetical protein n=1 Tax=Streptomyces sp. PSAA01 TaxID=2912762 RepID=UPI001F1764CC|nr:hypothetical protein [Streptomyces sp. PSAA01]MCG0286074.1 hypothetical protein [Streptomyces sp. PSAA01]
MSGTSRSHQNSAEAGNTTPEPQRHNFKQIAHTPPSPRPLSERKHSGDERIDRHLASMQAKVDAGERIPTPGSTAGNEDRDIHEEEWRAHDRHGPYGQRRRRKS